MKPRHRDADAHTRADGYDAAAAQHPTYFAVERDYDGVSAYRVNLAATRRHEAYRADGSRIGTRWVGYALPNGTTATTYGYPALARVWTLAAYAASMGLAYPVNPIPRPRRLPA